MTVRVVIGDCVVELWADGFTCDGEEILEILRGVK